MNISETLLKTLNHLIIPIVSMILSLILFFVFINPYNNYLASFDEMKSGYETSINTISKNLAILKRSRDDFSKLEKFDMSLKSLVPDTANPSELVGLIDSKTEEFRFRTIDENRSVTSRENDRNFLIEVRFNGSSPGIVSTNNFLKSLLTDKTKLFKITSLQITNIPEELTTRVSFSAFSIYAPPFPQFSLETPLENVYADEKFTSLLETF